MIFKRKFSAQNSITIFGEFALLYALFVRIGIYKILPSKDTKIVFALALIFIAWLFIKRLIFFRIELKESELDEEEKQKGFFLFIIFICLISLVTLLNIVVVFR